MGAPYLRLNDGGRATYTGGSGSNILTFTYVVAAGQNTADLSITGLALNGGSIKDDAGNNAVLAGAAGNPAGILQIDTIAPRVTSIVANPASADLNAGRTVALTVNFSELVNVAGGTPLLNLSDGATASYVIGSGSKALTFNYTVAEGENSANLTVLGLGLPNGTTIEDNAGNDANLAGAVADPAGILKIDTTAPVVNAVTTSPASGEVNTNRSVTMSLAMSEKVSVTGAPVLLLNDGGTALYKNGSGTSTLTFRYTVGAGEVTSDLRITGIVLPSPSAITDLSGNAANLSGAGADTRLGINRPPGSPVVSSGGNFTITGPTELELFSPSTEAVSFASGSTGILKLDASSQFSGTVAGLAESNFIDLADLVFQSNTTPVYTASGSGTGNLAVTEGASTANIALLGNYMASAFVASSDGHGGTLITDPPLNQQMPLAHPGG
jgi:hypothetical protein